MIMSRFEDLDEKAVHARMAAGQLPILDASYSLKSVFSDGTEVSHQVMSRIADSEILHAPKFRGQSWVRPMSTSSQIST